MKLVFRYRVKSLTGLLKGRELKREGKAFRFAGDTFRVFYSRPLPKGTICDGTNFSRDRRGNWFLNIVLELAEPAKRPLAREVGIDLGLKDLATLSTGHKEPAPQFYRTPRWNWRRRSGRARSGGLSPSTPRLPTAGTIFCTNCPLSSCVAST